MSGERPPSKRSSLHVAGACGIPLIIGGLHVRTEPCSCDGGLSADEASASLQILDQVVEVLPVAGLHGCLRCFWGPYWGVLLLRKSYYLGV